ncbi:MAG: replicative DNA helicase [Defluviitaleaceae bacterium]|nr:replicative DNA helicase [Defluviitaleaceae bacterium]
MEEYSDQIQRPMPRDEAAELAVISSMIFDAEALISGAEFVRPEDFYRLDYRLVFQALLDLHNIGTPVDLITLRNKLEEREAFDKVGGAEALAAIASSVSTSANIKQYIKIVLDRSMQRKLILASNEIQNDSYAGTKSVDSILDDAESAIFSIAEKRHTLGFIHINDALLSSIAVIEKAYKQGSKITGIESGFTDLDLKTAGFHPSDLILIAARPSMGKTAIALNMVAHAAIHTGVPTAIFSLEMSKEQLANRLIASEARVDAGRLRNGQLDPTDWAAIAESLGPLSTAPIFIDDTPGITVPQLRSKCRKLKLEHGLGLIVIDYLQLMSGTSSSGGGFASRQQEISEISRALKALAREMDAPVIALSQLSRAPESRSDRRPILSDLRESGAIEQDADLVCFIYRDEYYNPDTERPGVAEVIIAKQRNGATGTIELMYQGNYVRFVNLEQSESSGYAPF